MTDVRPPRRQKQKEPKLQPAPNSGTERLKTVVRRLPPNLPEEVFWQSVQAWVTDDSVTWKSYFPGKFRTKRMNKEGIPSRAYIAFKSEDQVATFSREYDGHVFRDKTGNESQAVVEFAPFQKVPTEKKKVDARNNTIDKDEDYRSFLESLKDAGKTESVALEVLVAASQPPPPPTTTPLLESLKAEKSAQRDKEAILRNHAHYKDVGSSGASSKREEAKKKAAVQAAKQQPSEPAAPLSKKAKKAAAAAAAAAAKKTSSLQVQAQDEQGSTTGKAQPAGAAPSIAKPSATVAGHGPRHRPPKAHAAKGDTPAPSLSAPTTSGPGAHSHSPQGPASSAPATADNIPPGNPGPVPAQGPRKGRPVVGLGRQFEAALSGAGVAIPSGPGGDRKKREKGGEPGHGAGGKGKHREDTPSGVAVPSILQRPEVGGGPDVVIMQRPHSPKVESLEHGAAEGGGGAGANPGPNPGFGRGSGRRGRGRGRGGHRGG